MLRVQCKQFSVQIAESILVYIKGVSGKPFSMHVFPGNQTHNLNCNALPLIYRKTGPRYYTLVCINPEAVWSLFFMHHRIKKTIQV